MFTPKAPPRPRDVRRLGGEGDEVVGADHPVALADGEESLQGRGVEGDDPLGRLSKVTWAPSVPATVYGNAAAVSVGVAGTGVGSVSAAPGGQQYQE